MFVKAGILGFHLESNSKSRRSTMKNFLLSAFAAAAMVATVSKGHAATINRDGVVGINKTFSAQTLNHGKLALGVHTHIIDDAEQLEGGAIDVDGVRTELKDYLTLSSSIFLGIGFGPYTDVGLSLPLYFEKFSSDNSALDMDHQYQGDLRYRLKIRMPFKDVEVVDLAVMLGGTVPTQLDHRGVIPRELEYITADPAAFDEGSSPFGAGRPTFLAGLGLTLDLGQVAEKFQFLWHFNIGIRKTNIGKEPPFEDVLFWSTAAEYEAGSFIRFFGEFHHESRFNKLGDKEFSTEPTTLTFGGVAQTRWAWISTPAWSWVSTTDTSPPNTGSKTDPLRMSSPSKAAPTCPCSSKSPGTGSS